MTLRQAWPYELQWLIERTSAGLTPQAKALCVVDSAGCIRGMVAYDNWTKNSVQAHMAADTPIAWRSLLPEVFRFPFRHVGMILGIIQSSNKASCRMVKALGFREVYRHVDGWEKGDDLVLFEMKRHECRYMVA